MLPLRSQHFIQEPNLNTRASAQWQHGHDIQQAGPMSRQLSEASSAKQLGPGSPGMWSLQRSACPTPRTCCCGPALATCNSKRRDSEFDPNYVAPCNMCNERKKVTDCHTGRTLPAPPSPGAPPRSCEAASCPGAFVPRNCTETCQ